jgi:hypothetical protein
LAVVLAGFVDFEITWRADVFSGAPQAGSAANFGTVGINFRARKTESEKEWLDALNRLSCEIPATKAAAKSHFKKLPTLRVTLNWVNPWKYGSPIRRSG